MSPFETDDDDPAAAGLLGHFASGSASGGLSSDFSRLDPGAAELAAVAWRGLRALAPNITNPATYAPLPPPSLTPTAAGKLPSADRDPRVEGVVGDLLNVALTFAPMPGLVPAAAARWLPGRLSARPPAQWLAAESPLIYNPPPKPPRPFEADYPRGAPSDATGRLTHDIEGRPLVARYVVGRSSVRGNEQAFPPAQFDALTEATTGRGVAFRSPRQMGQVFGRTYVDRVTGHPVLIELRAGMPPDKAAMVHAHELGHAIDQTVGRIPTTGLSDELPAVYNSLNNPRRTRGGLDADPGHAPMTPQAHGYEGDHIPREYIVEAIRAYLTDPNYLKTVAPTTAAAIREAVNAHPVLSKIIQFNTLAGPVAVIGGTEPIPGRAAPVQSQ
jgi:hypothetical protein